MTRKVVSRLLFICLLTCLQPFIRQSFAVPAKPDPVQINQPSGYVFTAFIKGDEFQGWIEAANGYSIIQNETTKYWEYAIKGPDGSLEPSGIIIPMNLAPPTGITPHLKPDKVIPVNLEPVNKGIAPYTVTSNIWAPRIETGDRKILVIMVAFSNKANVTTDASWNTTFFDTTPGAKSVANYYKDNSFNKISISPVTHMQTGSSLGVIKVTLPRQHPNYGRNAATNYYLEAAWINEALEIADNYVDFPALDTDGDDILDPEEANVYFIVAGYEASATTKTPSIGAHSFWGAYGVSAGGIELPHWALNGEVDGSGVKIPVGVPAHESGHAIFKFSELYDINNINSGIGVFSLMGAGCWGMTSSDTAAGDTPVALDAWTRQYVGWTNPRIPMEQGVMSFGPTLSSLDSTVKLANPLLSTSEYFLVENRPPVGWDQGLWYSFGTNWSGGLLVLHIDESIGDPNLNNINGYVSGSHQGVLVEEANTIYGSLMDTGTDRTLGYKEHLFYNGNNNSFLYNTSPNSNLYGSTPTYTGATNISAPAEVMTATVVPCPPVATPTFSPAGGIYYHPQDICINCSTLGATIRYTTDGSTPSENSPLYTGAIHVSSSKTLKAKAWYTDVPSSGTGVGTFTISDPVPVNESLTPNTGNIIPGTISNFTSVYSDPDGSTNLSRCDLLINKNLDNLNAIMVRYNAVTDKLYILKDDKSAWLGGITPGTDTILENTQGKLHCKDVIVTRTADKISISWSIEIKPVLAGNTCYAYMYVCDKQNMTDGWDKMGTFIFGRPPVNVSLTPNNLTMASGSKYTLTSEYSDPDGRTNLSRCDLLINKNLDNLNALVVRYNNANNKLYILKDDKSAWLGGVTPGTDTILENTQGKLYCKDVVVTPTAYGKNISWSIEIKPVLAGKTCYAYMYVCDMQNLTDGWDKMGTFVIQ